MYINEFVHYEYMALTEETPALREAISFLLIGTTAYWRRVHARARGSFRRRMGPKQEDSVIILQQIATRVLPSGGHTSS